MTGPLIAWPPPTAAGFGSQPTKADHRLHELALFDDEALIELLDRMPAAQLHVYTMGLDPVDHGDWHPVESAGVGGAALLDAVRRGRLWLNVLRVDQVDRRYAALLDQLYRELAGTVAGFTPTTASATLLVSSPDAMVHYHADAQPNLLWHLRGRKTVWVYPALDDRFLSTRDLQRIFAGQADEFVPYLKDWDDHATVLELAPGEVAWWPQNAPHRVVNNGGVNVSLSTEHRTRQTTRRERVWAANAMLSSRLHRTTGSTKESGPWPTVKVGSYLVVRRIVGRPRRPPGVPATLRVDPTAPQGYRPLPQR